MSKMRELFFKTAFKKSRRDCSSVEQEKQILISACRQVCNMIVITFGCIPDGMQLVDVEYFSTELQSLTGYKKERNIVDDNSTFLTSHPAGEGVVALMHRSCFKSTPLLHPLCNVTKISILFIFLILTFFCFSRIVSSFPISMRNQLIAYFFH